MYGIDNKKYKDNYIKINRIKTSINNLGNNIKKNNRIIPILKNDILARNIITSTRNSKLHVHGMKLRERNSKFEIPTVVSDLVVQTSILVVQTSISIYSGLHSPEVT